MSDAKKLSSLDASFLYLETPEMPMHVGSMAIFRLPDGYKGDFFEEFKAMIASRLHIAPILKARLQKAIATSEKVLKQKEAKKAANAQAPRRAALYARLFRARMCLSSPRPPLPRPPPPG